MDEELKRSINHYQSLGLKLEDAKKMAKLDRFYKESEFKIMLKKFFTEMLMRTISHNENGIRDWLSWMLFGHRKLEKSKKGGKT